MTGASQAAPCWVSLEAAGGEYSEREPRSVHCAASSSFGIMQETGELFAWGTGYLGFTHEGCVVPGPTKTRIPRHVVTPDPVELVACGPSHCLLICKSSTSGHTRNSAATRGGKAYSWGCGKNGVLGQGNEQNFITPTEIPGLSGFSIVSVGCGATFSVALDDQGKLHTWGRPAHGQLGRSVDQTCGKVPGIVTSASMSRVASFSCGRAHVLAHSASGELFSWGSASHGQTGHLSLAEAKDEEKEEDQSFIPSPRAVDICGINALMQEHNCEATTNPVSVVSVGAGDVHSMCVTSTGVVFGWGSNEFGQVGVLRRKRGKSIIVRRPTVIASLPVVASVSCGANHSAITDVGDVYVWDNSSGQLGLGDTKDRRTPVQLEAVLEHRAGSGLAWA